ncbi:hypothetical protein [Goodfellowiella coeruleoviolacea]|nr:hypothetical protein [Goodfellowiella coeruleoviolacea]
MLSSGPPCREQLVRAALLYAGDRAVITGLDALHRQGAWPLEPSGPVHVLIPATRRVTSRGFVLVERTTRLPDPRHHAGLPLPPTARAVLDAARRERDPNQVRTLLVEAIRHGACTLTQLRNELDAGSQRGSAQPRQALQSLTGHVHLITEAWARRIVAHCPIPPPSWLITDGLPNQSSPSRVVHAWWQDVGLLWHIGARAHHRQCVASAGHSAVTADTVLDNTPLELHSSPEDVRRGLAAAYLRAASGRSGGSLSSDHGAVAGVGQLDDG